MFVKGHGTIKERNGVLVIRRRYRETTSFVNILPRRFFAETCQTRCGKIYIGCQLWWHVIGIRDPGKITPRETREQHWVSLRELNRGRSFDWNDGNGSALIFFSSTYSGVSVLVTQPARGLISACKNKSWRRNITFLDSKKKEKIRRENGAWKYISSNI